MTAIVFPGQGSQFVEMGKDFYDSFQEVKDTFDSVVEVTSKNLDRSNCTIVEKNKVIIENLIPAIEKLRLSRDYYRQTSSNTSRNQQPRPTMQVVYDSDSMNMNNLNQRYHVKKSEQSDYNIDQFNKQKMERELTLDPKIPADIDFTDKSVECDSPIGEDMDRLIAERLATRERELSLVPPPLTSISNSNSSMDSKNVNGSTLQNKDFNSHGEERKVTFSKDIEQIDLINQTDHYDSGGISSKLKKLKLKRSDVLPNNQKEEIEVDDDVNAEDRRREGTYVSSTSGDNNYVSEAKYEALLRRVTHLESIINNKL